MKIFTDIKQIFMTMMILPLLSFFFCTNALASINSNKSNEAHSKPPLLGVKDYHDHALTVQFRYINGTLHFVRFLNVSQIPMELHFLDMNYILGPSDAIIVNAPHVKYMSVTQKPYAVKTSSLSNMMFNSLSKTHVYAIESQYSGG
ncbi:MAG: hypothetical protein AB7F64_06710 [Gammaproteobacteria bacterium]